MIETSGRDRATEKTSQMQRLSSLVPRRFPLASSAIVLCLWLAAASSATARPAQDVFVSRPAADTVIVRFVVTAPDDTPADTSVYLAGSLPAVGNWKANGVRLERQDDGTYFADITLEVGTTLEYKFNCGTWETVEKSANASDIVNRSITIGVNPTRIDTTIERWAGADAITEPASTVVGTLERHEIDSAALGAKRTLRVWLPPDYDANAATKYDVLYMHDGQNCFDCATSAFGHEWEIDETLTEFIAEKKVRPIIVVGIDNGGAKRIDEMTFDADANHGGGHAGAYAKFLLEEVRPFVEKTYHVNAGREHTFLGGSSLGGLVSLEIARRNPDQFAGVIAMSPSLWWNDQSLPKAIEHDAGGLKNTRVWIDMGTREAGDAHATEKNAADVTGAKRLDAALNARGIEHHLEIAEGAQHNEEAWAKRFPDAIRYLLEGVTP
jgi:predicted alpha/beta superfamily hydrolase